MTETVTPEPPTADELTLRPRDFQLRVKITERQCFGSAGCNVGYEIEPLYAGGSASDLDDVTVDVTYEVSGPEDGNHIGTITFDGGMYDTPADLASTSGEGVELRATVTEVSVY